MISIRTNFFYTRSVPCELWFFDKGKPKARRDQVLMIDARNICRKLTRKIYDFTSEQQQNLTSIVWLYRGETDRFISLVQQYLEKTLTEAAGIAAKSAGLRTACDAIKDATAPFLKTLAKDSPVREVMKERDDAAKACFKELEELTQRIVKDWKQPCAAKLPAQKNLLGELDTLATACRDLIKTADLMFKLSTRVVDVAEPGYLGVKMSENQTRVVKMFGRGNRDLKRLRTFESGLQERLMSGRGDVMSLDRLNQLAAMQVNALRMTPFMPCRISEQPAEDLNRLFQGLVEPIKSMDSSASRIPLKQMLEDRFSAPEIAIRIRRKVKVHIPYLGRDEEIPYAYQNGRLNLIAPVTFPKTQSALQERASKYALEGQSLFEV